MTTAPSVLINIDVPDIDAAVKFYTSALGLELGRRFDAEFVELISENLRIYLLKKEAGTSIGPAGGDIRRYQRHWCPVHPDFVVADIETVIKNVIKAGAVQEGETMEAPYGRLAMFADPFGHGFCLIEFNGSGYDALLNQTKTG